MKKTTYIFMAALISVLLSMEGSQALALFEGYGSIVPSSEVTDAFESYQVDPNLTYYVCTSTSNPKAIIGVDKALTLDSDLWQKIEMTPKVLKDLVYTMQITTRGMDLFGFTIRDDKGKPIGVWYSRPFATTFVKMKNEKTVHIQTVRPRYQGHRYAKGY